MATGMGKNESPAEYDSGAGQVHERTITIGDTLIVIDSIASIQILEIRPGWLLALLGLVTAGGGVGAMTLLNTLYGSADSNVSLTQIGGLILVGGGLAMIVGNWLLPIRHSLRIGTSDGRTSYVVSKDQAFLHLLLEVLTRKINTRNESVTAKFDITHSTFNINVDCEVATPNAAASNATGHLRDFDRSSMTADGALLALDLIVVAAPAPESDPATAIDPDEALFADDPYPAPPSRSVEPSSEPLKPSHVDVATQTGSRQPLRDVRETAARVADDREWLSMPSRIGYASAPEGRGARWLLPCALLLLAGGGSFAGWYFYRQSQIRPLESSLALQLGAVSRTGP